MEKNAKTKTNEKSSSKAVVSNSQDTGKISTNDSNKGKTNHVDSAQETTTNSTEEISNIYRRKLETVDDLKTQLGILMNSIATLSAEKSRMEAVFQSDRRQLRAERDEHERLIKDLKDKLKRAQHSSHSELEHVKYKLIMERHEREKEQADNSAMIKELQRLVTDERRGKDSLEQQLREWKNQISNKTQNKILEAELEVANQRLKQVDAAGKEPPPMLLALQGEISSLRKQHRSAIHEERKRAAAAEQQAKALERAHEARVANLEARLAELSEAVGGYERLRQQDQHAIQKLKEELSKPTRHESRVTTDQTEDPEKICSKIRELYSRLVDINNQTTNTIDIEAFLKSLKLHDNNQDIEYKQKYEMIQKEFENYKQQMSTKLKAPLNVLRAEKKHIDSSTELQLVKSYSKNLEERVRILNKEATSRENEMKVQLQNYTEQLQEDRIRLERSLAQKEAEYRGQIANLEHQILRQRERSLALIESKDQEINTLKSSFRAIMMKHNTAMPDVSADKSVEPVSDFVTSLLTADSPPLLHYAQELARREIQVTGLRKQYTELEAKLRDRQRDMLAINQRHEDEVKIYETKITRLEAYKSREGANLEYLKNVFVNYLSSTDSSGKRHMLNAIATVLKFTAEELEKIQRSS